MQVGLRMREAKEREGDYQRLFDIHQALIVFIAIGVII